MEFESRLRKFVQDAGRAKTRGDLASAALYASRDVFGAHLTASLLLDAALNLTEIAAIGGTEVDIEEYRTHYRSADRTLLAAVTRLRPIHNWMVFSAHAWQSEQITQEFKRRLAIEHYLVTPIFTRGGLAGTVHIARRPQDDAFTLEDMQVAATLSAIASANLVTLPKSGNRPTYPLTRRQLQIARLAAAGHNNVEIAHELGIARETVKQTLRRTYDTLEVRGRAEMATCLAHFGLVDSGLGDPLALLSPRERDVLRRMLAGQSDKVIAYDLGLASSTVRVLLGRAKAKLGARSRADLIAIANRLFRDERSGPLPKDPAISVLT